MFPLTDAAHAIDHGSAGRAIANPAAMADEIKALVRRLGGDVIVGIAEITDAARLEGGHVPWRNAICIGMPMDRAIMEHAPQPRAGTEVMRAYRKVARVAIERSEHIRAMGWPVKAFGETKTTDLIQIPLAMAEKGLDWEDKNVDLMKGEQVSPDYLKINPKGVVPTLVDDGQPIIESTIILEYLEDAYPAHPLRPEAPVERARMRVWTKTPDDGLHAACGTVSYAAAFGKQVADFHGAEALEARLARLPDRARAARQREMYEKGMDASFLPEHVRLHDKVLGEMEARLADHDWLAGDAYSLAECALLPYVWRLERLGFEGMWGDRPSVADWFARCKARPSWDRAMERYQALPGPDYDDDLKSKGVDLWPKVKAMLAAHL